MTDLGWMNNWKEEPQQVLDCKLYGHRRKDEEASHKFTGIEHVVTCLDGCDYVYRYDSSD